MVFFIGFIITYILLKILLGDWDSKPIAQTPLEEDESELYG